MILVTGAAGKTGQAVTRTLARRGATVRALVHRQNQIDAAKLAGAGEVIVGDLLDEGVLQTALTGAQAVYLICPNVHPQEFEIGHIVITAAKASARPRIVYHSVMYPQIEAMPHHWQKLRVEEELIASGLDFTILQPASYMQNVAPYWQAIIDTGEYKVPYSVAAMFSPIDLNDVAEVAALALTDPAHTGAIYQLAGPETISSREIATALTSILGKEVRAAEQPLANWVQVARTRNLSPYAMNALSKMFAYYNKHGFSGSSVVLEKLLERRAKTFSQFAAQLYG